MTLPHYPLPQTPDAALPKLGKENLVQHRARGLINHFMLCGTPGNISSINREIMPVVGHQVMSQA